MKCFLVSHTHWDREWYRTFQGFRARLVDAIDRVLDLLASDPGFRFLLDGQTVVIDDYLEIRPERREELERACREGRLAIGPWYVQPDSLLPSGEAHVRNLLEGRRSGGAIGPVSRVAYTPDSFGHPAQLPQLLAGFGLTPFVYWRGNADELDELPAEYLWEAPSGDAVLAHHLWRGYFSAGALPYDASEAARWLEKIVQSLAERTRNDRVLLMNGVDHALPDLHTGDVVAALEAATGWSVERGLLEDFAGGLAADAPRFRGELVGGRIANLLPGVWSTRTPLKLRNRRAESALEGWAEPWAALGRVCGARDEGPALRAAWRPLLQNQAHDSICGCSQDRVHEQMEARYDAAEELADETTRRTLERLAGLGDERRTPWSDALEVAVFNPSPWPRTDVVRVPLEPIPFFEMRGESSTNGPHPLLRRASHGAGFDVDGAPARVVVDPATDRVHLLPERAARSVEFVASEVPALGWQRFRLESAEPCPDEEDRGREIAVDDLAVAAAENGTLDVRLGDRTFRGLGALEDRGDRGDTYDFDPVDGEPLRLRDVQVVRRRHPSGIQHLRVRRVVAVPAELDPSRERRSDERVDLVVETEARLAPGLGRVDLCVRVENTARDHRLRLLFPTGAPAERFAAATTFDVAERETAPRDARRWIHPAPTTFPQQGFVAAGGLTLAAPGLPEAEVTPEGRIAITLVRSVGWLSRHDLETRPGPAGPAFPTPGAQCLETIEARLSLLPGLDPRGARDAELGLRGVFAGEEPLLAPGTPLLELATDRVLLSALKPADDGAGVILRLLNPTDDAIEARARLGGPLAERLSRAVSTRLDESPSDAPVSLASRELLVSIPPRALRTVRLID